MNNGAHLTFTGNGTVKGIPQPVAGDDAANKTYIDSKFGKLATDSADAGKAPVLGGDGRLHPNTLPSNAVKSVNSVTPDANGNVGINFVGTQSGAALPGNNQNTPTAVLTNPPTPMGGQTDGVVFIISGNTSGIQPDPNGQAFIWSGSGAQWLEISPPGLGSTDARYVNLTGDTMTGDLTMNNSKTVILGRDPSSAGEAATKQYVDNKVGSQGVTGDLFTLGSTMVGAGSTQTTLTGLTSVTAGSFTGTFYGVASQAGSLQTSRTISATGDGEWSVSFNGGADVSGTLTLKNVGNTGGGNFRKVSVDTAGRVIGQESVAAGDITGALGYTPVNRAGDTMQGDLNMNGKYLYNVPAPNGNDQAANKKYVDDTITTAKDGLSLNSLNNVNATPGNGDVLQWNGNQWVAGTVSATGSIKIGDTSIALGGSTANLDSVAGIGIGSASDGTYGLNMPNKNARISETHTSRIGVGTQGVASGFAAEIVGNMKLRADGGSGGAVGMVFAASGHNRLWYLGTDGEMRMALSDGSFNDQGAIFRVNGAGTVTTNNLMLQGSDGLFLGSNTTGSRIYTEGDYGNSDIVFRAGSGGAEKFFKMERNGVFSVLSGDIYSAGNITAFSDERVKTKWNSFATDFVSKLANVKSGSYTRIDTGERQVGVSAQSLREVMPEAVMENDEGMLSVVYGHAALASSVELAKKVVALEAQIDELKALVAKLMER